LREGFDVTDQEGIETACRDLYQRAKIFLDDIQRTSYFGYKIFNAPPVLRPPILFIGYQPGGGADAMEN
jgi:hypothetical protein